MYLCGEGRVFKCVCVCVCVCVSGGAVEDGRMGLYLQKREFSLRITYEETARHLLKSCLSFGESLEGSNEEKMGRQQKEEVP